MDSISKSNKNTPIHIPLDFQNVPELPDSHKWDFATLDHEHTPVPQEQLTQQPVVTVVDLSHPHAPKHIREACENLGAFQVINHGIPVDLFNEIEHQGKRLFRLPLDRKLLALRSPDGFSGYGKVRISNFFNKQMWNEGFTIVGSPEQHARQLWPHDYTKFCAVMEAFQAEMKKVAERIIEMMLKSLGLTQEDLEWFDPKTGHYHSQGFLQLNSYPGCPDPSQAMGLAPHTDSSLLTLLYQGNVSGLQVHKESIGWVTVQPINGAIEFFVGDLLHMISNGRFKNVLHRVVVNKTHHRITTAYFYGPPKDVKLSPLMKLTDFDHPTLFRAVTWKEYLDAKAVHFNNTLEVIKCGQLDS